MPPHRFAVFVAALVATAPASRTRASGALPSAARATAAVQLDGHPDEPAWDAARAFDAFVEIYPREGEPARRRTEARILYDDERLYVAFRCEGEPPGEVARPLGRRDHIPSGSDSVAIAIDAAHDRRTAYFFAVSAGGVLEDRLLYDDVEETGDWDAVWDAAVAASPEGWTAELAIPFSALRFMPQSSPVFGVYLERKVGRTHEVLASALIPLGAGAFVSRFSDLEIGPLAHVRHLELAPFAAARLATRPAGGESATGPRISDPSGDVGLDFSLPLATGLGLVGTVNPDFGQVEADPVILNLTRYEPFFPENRPFFLRDLDLFQPVGGASGDVPQQLVYTRRIGVGAPVLAAGKLTGQLAPGLDVGVLDAFVASGAARADDRQVRLHAEQPLHLAPEDAYAPVAPVPQNFLAGALRLGSARTSFVGLQATLATPVAPACTEGDARLDLAPGECAARGGAAAAALFALRSPAATYGLVGQVAGSRSLGGPPSRLLPDGTILHPGDVGWGAYITAGKLGGEPLRATVSYEVVTPRLDLNATGFQPDQNEQTVHPEIRFVRRAGIGALHEVSAGASATLERSTDGRRLDLGRSLRGNARVVLPGYHEVACDGGFEAGRTDLREIVETGIPYERPPSLDVGCSFASDRHRSLAFEASGGVTGTVAAAPLPGTFGWRARAGAFVRPHPRVETIVTAEVESGEIPGRFVSQDGRDLLFADLSALSVSLKLRQQLVFTPHLALQGYVQVFAAYERYGPYASAVAPGSGVLRLGELRPSAAPDDPPDVMEASLRANVVLRWEYRPGSVLHLVYSRESQDAAPAVGAAPRIRLGLLGRAPSTDVFLAKLTYWFAP